MSLDNILCRIFCPFLEYFIFSVNFSPHSLSACLHSQRRGWRSERSAAGGNIKCFEKIFISSKVGVFFLSYQVFCEKTFLPWCFCGITAPEGNVKCFAKIHILAFFVPLSTVLDRWVEKSVLDRSPVTGLRGKLLQRDGSVFCNCEHCGCIVA